MTKTWVHPIEKPYEEVLARVKTHLTNRRLTQVLEAQNRELVETNERLEQEIAGRVAAESARAETAAQLKLISAAAAAHWDIADFVGKSRAVDDILDAVRRLQQADTTGVLITGESGTGKELIARTIHFGSTRAKGPFIPVNCAAIPGELAESLLFGHTKGAFTGATASRKGHFEQASGGTLFLDEIADMSLNLQAKLLHVLESNDVVPIGGVKGKAIDVG
ncbi:sigma-54 factor interaction domain-containing protein [Candidatus Poribacteria bacterium]|nr:sigma-54 factor interaction domain-containing protein [Candidatus Poribacteria bacterium]